LPRGQTTRLKNWFGLDFRQALRCFKIKQKIVAKIVIKIGVFSLLFHCKTLTFNTGAGIIIDNDKCLIVGYGNEADIDNRKQAKLRGKTIIFLVLLVKIVGVQTNIFGMRQDKGKLKGACIFYFLLHNVSDAVPVKSPRLKMILTELHNQPKNHFPYLLREAEAILYGARLRLITAKSKPNALHVRGWFLQLRERESYNLQRMKNTSTIVIA